MKITVKQLKQLIKEQVEEQMTEAGAENTMVQAELKRLINDLGGPTPSARQAILVALNQVMPPTR